MKPTRRKWFAFLTDWAIRLGGSRDNEHDQQARINRIDHPATTHRWRLRMTSFLRDRLRPKWLRKK